MALSRLAFKKIALTVSSALLVFSAISIQAQQEFDTALNKLAPATQSVVKSLSQLDRLPAPQWRTHIADMAHGEALELDDSTWEMAHMPGQMSREAMWYRAWIEVPKDVHGYDVTGARIWFSFHVWSDGDWTKIVYFNGRRVALGEGFGANHCFRSGQARRQDLIAVKLSKTVDVKHVQGADFYWSRPPAVQAQNALARNCSLRDELHRYVREVIPRKLIRQRLPLTWSRWAVEIKGRLMLHCKKRRLHWVR